MKRNSVLKKFDKEIENLEDILYAIKEILESTDDYELSELGSLFVTQIEDKLQEGDISVKNIREQISG